VAQMIAPFLGTWSFAWGISEHHGLSIPGMPFFVAALLIAGGGVLAWIALHRTGALRRHFVRRPLT